MRDMEGATWTCSEILVTSFEKLQVKLLWKFKFVYNFYITYLLNKITYFNQQINKIKIFASICKLYMYIGMRKTYKGSNVHMFTRIFRVLFDMKIISQNIEGLKTHSALVLHSLADL